MTSRRRGLNWLVYKHKYYLTKSSVVPHKEEGKKKRITLLRSGDTLRGAKGKIFVRITACSALCFKTGMQNTVRFL